MGTWHSSAHSAVITESGWCKETTKGIFGLVYLQSSVGHKVKTLACLACLLPSAGPGGGHECGPPNTWHLGTVIVFPQLTCLPFYFLLKPPRRILFTVPILGTWMLPGQSMSKGLWVQQKQEKTRSVKAGRDLPSLPH